MFACVSIPDQFLERFLPKKKIVSERKKKSKFVKSGFQFL